MLASRIGVLGIILHFSLAGLFRGGFEGWKDFPEKLKKSLRTADWEPDRVSSYCFTIAARFPEGKQVGLKAQMRLETSAVFFQPRSRRILGGWEGGGCLFKQTYVSAVEHAHIGATRNPEKEECTYSEEYRPLDSALGSCSHTWSFSASSRTALPEAWSR